VSGTIGYLGPQGTFSEEALIAWIGADQASRERAYPSIEGCFEGVASGEVREALVPIENAIEGGVSQTLDQLIAGEGRIVIRGEVIHPIHHHLIGAPGESLDSVTRVVSHPQATAQCGRWLRSRLPGVPVDPALSTADAVRAAAVADDGIAAVGNRRAAQIYGGEILAEDIMDAADNRTRFAIIGTEECAADEPGAYTTSIICGIATDRPGALLSILQEFALRAINLTRLESRPARTGLGRYVFFIDAEGNRYRDLPLQAALTAIEEGGIAHVTSLGCYPTATEPV
jgi:prephenate dehydratase